MLRWLRRLLLGIVAVVVALLLFGFAYELIAEAVDRADYPPPGRMVDVGGYRMHLYCSGEGSPTVLLNGASLDTVSD